MHKVLIVEDNWAVQQSFARALAGKVTVIPAYTIPQAKKLFGENPDLSAIAMDACVPGNSPNTLYLTHFFRSTFFGPMIAISSEENYRQQLMRAGCDHKCPKGYLSVALCTILGIDR